MARRNTTLTVSSTLRALVTALTSRPNAGMFAIGRIARTFVRVELVDDRPSRLEDLANLRSTWTIGRIRLRPVHDDVEEPELFGRLVRSPALARKRKARREGVARGIPSIGSEILAARHQHRERCEGASNHQLPTAPSCQAHRITPFALHRISSPALQLHREWPEHQRVRPEPPRRLDQPSRVRNSQQSPRRAICMRRAHIGGAE